MELSLIIEVITGIAVVLGILFGLLQLRHYHLSRERETTLFLLNSIQSTEFIQGIWNIEGIPNGLVKDKLRERLGDEIRNVHLVMSTWERIGILVFTHEIPMRMVRDVYGSMIKVSWQKLEGYISDMRKELKRDTYFEWFQWLAERMMEGERSKPQEPAYLAYRNWK